MAGFPDLQEVIFRDKATVDFDRHVRRSHPACPHHSLIQRAVDSGGARDSRRGRVGGSGAPGNFQRPERDPRSNSITGRAFAPERNDDGHARGFAGRR